MAAKVKSIDKRRVIRCKARKGNETDGRGIRDPNGGPFEGRGIRGRSFMKIAGASVGVNG